MKNTEKKYNALIGKLRNAIPVDGNPDLLTNKIMQSISLHPKSAPSRLLVWVRPLMTAAAIFLLGLFFFQQYETTNYPQEIAASRDIKLTPLYKPNCNSESTMKLQKNRKLLNEYICYMKSNQAENENSKQFYLKYLPKNQETIAQ
jgi:hypothetical protein